jgi:hypothetical protein
MAKSTVNVPLIGKANKGTVIGVTIGGFAVAGYLIYREVKKSQAQSAAAATAATTATGYGYGTATGYGYGTGYYGYGDDYGYGSSGSFMPSGYYGYGVTEPQAVAATTNAQWVQAAITQLTDEGYDAQTVSAALGAYTEGQAVTAAQDTIIQAAIGIEGYPPDPGANGYPPSINESGTTGGGTGGGQTGSNGVPAPTNVTATPSGTSAKISWTAAAGAQSYHVRIDGGAAKNVTGTSYTAKGLKKGQHQATVATRIGTNYSPYAVTSFTIS